MSRSTLSCLLLTVTINICLITYVANGGNCNYILRGVSSQFPDGFPVVENTCISYFERFGGYNFGVTCDESNQPRVVNFVDNYNDCSEPDLKDITDSSLGSTIYAGDCSSTSDDCATVSMRLSDYYNDDCSQYITPGTMVEENIRVDMYFSLTSAANCQCIEGNNEGEYIMVELTAVSLVIKTFSDADCSVEVYEDRIEFYDGVCDEEGTLPYFTVDDNGAEGSLDTCPGPTAEPTEEPM